MRAKRPEWTKEKMMREYIICFFRAYYEVFIDLLKAPKEIFDKYELRRLWIAFKDVCLMFAVFFMLDVGYVNITFSTTNISNAESKKQL
jgi:hypothetical protein